MNIIKYKLARPQRHGLSRNVSNRDGLSVIEVLTSIVVALIGVFGVLAMIPFSIKQTQSGLDNDAATSMARNALADFEASGYKVVSGANNQLNWVQDAANTPVTAAAGSPLVCLDPLGVAEQGAFNSFPFHCLLGEDENEDLTGTPLQISSVNLVRPDGTQFGVAEARRMFRLTDALVFAESDDPTVTDSDLLGPVQLFNEGVVGGANVSLNRQSNGTVSWCAVAQPVIKNAATTTVDSYKLFVLVFKDRVTDSTDEDSVMAAALVTSPKAAPDATEDLYVQPLSNVTIDTPLNDNVRRNDWVMLINQDATTNVAFARITNLDSDATTARLTLNGSDFNFPINTETYIVHLRDVVAVFPRTIKLETASGWTVSAD